ncbi:ABC transporter permease [Clostridium lacusfryxellense]|uniref:ABC transporter permease n=1 Tax=Clostridium lacusfryxellense TaxID=205328 RepID=UPI001C0B7B27|nr:ABC transporter permease [Clostridium lacusfryxellense]MBU3110287.1 ABC transporter permease [Clostridium lacusfryxellense]
MKLAWKELKHSKAKYLLIESIIILMIFMVIFLSGLANGLARAVSASIENADAKHYVISNDAENLIGTSSLPTDVLKQVSSMTTDNVTNLDIQRTSLTADGNDKKLDVTYFAIDPNGFLSPHITQGKAMSNSGTEYNIVLNDSFNDDSIAVGDVVEDSSSGIKMTVAGFTRDEMYGHSPVGFISTETYSAINIKLNPSFSEKYKAIAIQGSDIDNIRITGASVVDKDTIVDNLPGYQAEQLTINMILWVLVVISAAILGVFFYVITIQKLKQFGILKAIGIRMSELTSMIIAQVLILALFGVVIGNFLAFGMASMLPSSMPFHLEIPIVIIISVVFIVITLFTSLLSIRKVAKIDPIIIIGGNE